MDGPAHAVVRRVASRAFTARRIDTFRPRVRRLVDALIDDLLAGPRPADLVAALVAPLPVYVVCDVLGVPVADRPRFYGWIEGLNSVTAYGSADAATAQAELRAYLAGQLADKRVNPGDDLLSAWVLGRDAHELVDAELVELAMGVLLGGLEINSTSAGVRALFQHPEQLAKLRAHPDKLSSATDEILRYTSVSSMFRVQVVQEDLTLGGVAMRAGDCVMAIPWAGNRDPRVFPEPERLRHRPGADHPAPHLRLRAALLPGHRAGPDAGGAVDRRAAAAVAGADTRGADRGDPVAARPDERRHRVVSGHLVTGNDAPPAVGAPDRAVSSCPPR